MFLGYLSEPEEFCLFVSCHHFGANTMYFGLSETNSGEIVKY